MRKYDTELIPVKSYKEVLVFLVARTLKDTRNNSLKLAKVFSQQPILFKNNVSLHSNASQYSGAIKASKKFASPIKGTSTKKLLSRLVDFEYFFR